MGTNRQGSGQPLMAVTEREHRYGQQQRRGGATHGRSHPQDQRPTEDVLLGDRNDQQHGKQQLLRDRGGAEGGLCVAVGPHAPTSTGSGRGRSPT